MLQIIQKSISLLIPPVCPVCEKNLINPSRELICRACFHKVSLSFADERHVKPAGRIPVYFPLIYTEQVKRMMHLFKFENFESMGRFFAQAMVSKLEELGIDFDIITYIPSHPARIREKGSYPTRFLAMEIARMSGRPVKELLRATRYKRSQISAKDRAKNVKDIFEAVDGMEIEGIILLVDDVITTGSTMAEAGKVLHEAGYKRIVGITAAGKV